jgi:hypothetical protein
MQWAGDSSWDNCHPVLTRRPPVLQSYKDYRYLSDLGLDVIAIASRAIEWEPLSRFGYSSLECNTGGLIEAGAGRGR